MNLKAVIFDLDDTLYTDFSSLDREGYIAADQYAQQQFGLDEGVFLHELQQAKAGLRARLTLQPESHDRLLFAQIALENLGINPIRHAERIFEIYWRTMMAGMQVEPQAQELLVQLREHGIRVILCTNMTAQIQMRKLVLLDLDNLVDAVVTSEEAGIDKPNPEIFELAVQKAGCNKAECIMVGDSYNHDIVGACTFGLHAIWICRDEKTEKPVDGFSYTIVNTFSQAAQSICALQGIGV